MGDAYEGGLRSSIARISTDSARRHYIIPNSEVEFGASSQLVESELPALMTSRTKRVFGFFGSNPSPVPHRLITTPAAVHPLPNGEGRQR